jgi:glutaredoxin-dependent peroxiredoxin
MAVQVGDKAIDFTLRSHKGEDIQLSSQLDENVLLLFFPFAFTGVCTTELCMTRDNLAFYNNIHAKIFGISVDSQFTLAKFAEANDLNFPLLSDFNKTVSEQYGSLYDRFIGYYDGVSKRSAFIVDKSGVIQYAEVLESAGDLPNFEEINSILTNLNSK